MGDISNIKADLVSKIGAATGLTVQTWHGDIHEFNTTRPAIWLGLDGWSDGENEEIGAISYIHNITFLVFADGEDNLPATYADIQAATLLESVAAALNGVEIASIGVANPKTIRDGMSTVFVAGHAGICRYAQAWEIERYKA